MSMKIYGKIISGVEVGKVVKYDCIKCGDSEQLEFNTEMSERTKNLFKDMLDERLCLCCYTGTDKRIEGAAESLQGILLN